MRKIIPIFCTLAVLAFGICAQEADDTDAVGVSEIYLAKDDGTGKAGEAATQFKTNDVPIFCVVQLNSGESATVKMSLVVVSVPGVKPETKVVSTSYTTKDLQDRVNFSGRPNGKWLVGRYRVDIFVNDKPAGSREFIVQKPAAARPSTESSAPAKLDSKPKIAGRVRKT